ncbi:unnamed protein product [Blepharisma stoltei]|uniref:PX domain-containing protein n=1 Tax=Blepharisma stoltei TaxID=1481888 RepID=A0AAU9JDI4_9CILI|nr:unnamed protein product [Blepharisma stoltei]
MSYLIAINDYQKQQNYIEYILLVKDTQTGETWSIKRRYSVLRKLYESLIKYSQWLDFPPKKFFGNTSPQFIDHRRRELEIYFTELLKIPEIYQVPAFQEFIKPKDRETIRDSGSSILINGERPKRSNKKALTLTYRQIAEDTTTHFIDLSVQPNFLTEEDAERRASTYAQTLNYHDIVFEQVLPEGYEINKTQLDKPIQDIRGRLEKYFQEFASIMAEPLEFEPIISKI